MSLMLIGFLLLNCNIHAEQVQHTQGTQTARSYVLMEASSGQVLQEHNKDEVLPPASMTKIMTLLLIYEAVDLGKIQWDDEVTISEHAAGMGGSQIFLEPGEVQKVRDLVKAIAIASANDAAVAMGEYIAGSETGFVDMMNKKAEQLGMQHTVFKNTCGLHLEGHVSTAYDVALMSRELMIKYPEVSKTLTVWMDTIVHKTKRGEETFGLTNTNKMIKWYNGITGLKTGYTPEAKHCVSATAKREDMELIAVVVGAQDSKARFREAGNLLDYGFAQFMTKQGPSVGEVLGVCKVKKGDAKEVQLTIEKTMTFVVPKTNKDVQLNYTIEVEDTIYAPIYKGQAVGEIKYELEGKEVGSDALVAAQDVGKAKLKHMIPYMSKSFFSTQH